MGPTYQGPKLLVELYYVLSSCWRRANLHKQHWQVRRPPNNPKFRGQYVLKYWTFIRINSSTLRDVIIAKLSMFLRILVHTHQLLGSWMCRSTNLRCVPLFVLHSIAKAVQQEDATSQKGRLVMIFSFMNCMGRYDQHLSVTRLTISALVTTTRHITSCIPTHLYARETL